MARSVVTVSRLLGAGGAEVGQMVADRLGCRCLDEEIVQRAAEVEGISVAEVADVERRASILERLMAAVARSGGGDVYAVGYTPQLVPDAVRDPASLRSLIQRALHEAADDGQVVIVSHAASFALADRDDVLRVLVTASPATRSRRAAAGLADGGASDKAVAADDAARAAYLKRFYDVRQELPIHYDLVLNSDRLSLDALAELVVRAAKPD
jgi:cytidylate kinase